MYKPLSRKSAIEIHLTNGQKETYLSHLSPDLLRLKTDYGIKIENWNLPDCQLMDKTFGT